MNAISDFLRAKHYEHFFLLKNEQQPSGKYLRELHGVTVGICSTADDHFDVQLLGRPVLARVYMVYNENVISVRARESLVNNTTFLSHPNIYFTRRALCNWTHIFCARKYVRRRAYRFITDFDASEQIDKSAQRYYIIG